MTDDLNPQYFSAWYAVTQVLDEVAPDWHEGEGTGKEKACAAIRALAAPPSPSSEPVPLKTVQEAADWVFADEAFQRSLASTDAHDPQSFIDGAKWQADRPQSVPAQRRALETELEALKHDNASLLDSLNKEAAARCDLEDLLGEVAHIKRYDRNGGRGAVSTSHTLNVPTELLERIDRALLATGGES